MNTCRLITCGILVSLASAFSSAQTAPNIMGTEIFVVPNPSATFGFDNVIVQDAAGAQFTFDMVLPASVLNGTYGPVYEFAATWRLEPLWLQNTATGITAGHMHIATAGGNPTNYENSHAQGTDYQGFRITRVDGAAFQLVSLDYNNNGSANLLVGTDYSSGWASIAASWVPVGPAEGLMNNVTTWTTYNFTVIPPDFNSLLLDTATSQINFNTTNNTFTVSSTIIGYVTTNGLEITNANLDSIIGAGVTMVGSYVGTDITTLQGTIFLNTTTSLVVVPGADQLTTTNTFLQSLGAGDQTVFGGALDATPIRRRALGQSGPSVFSRTGSGSNILDIMNSALGTELLTLNIDLDLNGPVVYAIDKNFVLPSPIPEARLRTNNFGSVQLGILGIPPGSQIINVAVINPTYAVNTGPFYGIAFGGDQILQLSAPLGLQPFRVTASPIGSYFYGAPSNSVPIGLMVDLLSVYIAPSGTIDRIGTPQRVTF